MTKPIEASISPEHARTPNRETTDTTADTEFSPAQKEVLGLLGWFYLINGKFNLSVDLLTALNSIDPLNLPAIKMLCYAYLKCDNYKKALLYSDLLLELSFTAEEKLVANLLKSRALWGAGRRDEANELMRLVIAGRKEMRNVIV
jgi:tetratricopeptide (TPR) repeat protein